MTEHDFNSRMVRTVFTVTAVGIALALMWQARVALMLIYVSMLIAMGFSPLVRFIEHPDADRGTRRVPRLLAILVIYLATVVLIGIIGGLVIPPLLEQATTLWTRLPQHFADMQRLMIQHRLMSRRVTFQEAVENTPAGSGANAVTTVVSALWGVTGGLLGLVTIVILSFYFLIEAEAIMEYGARFLPAGQRAHFEAAARAAVEKVSAWLRAQLTLAAVMGACAAVGLGLLQLPYFYVVALVAAVGETIPIIGPIVAGVTAVVIALSVSPRLAIFAGLFFLVLHQLESNVLVPKIMERRVGVSPVTVIVSLLIGAALWGLIGAILAIPTAAILSVTIDEFAAPRRRASADS